MPKYNRCLRLVKLISNAETFAITSIPTHAGFLAPQTLLQKYELLNSGLLLIQLHAEAADLIPLGQQFGESFAFEFRVQFLNHTL